MAEAAERADDLVAAEQHAVAVADLAHALGVAGRRHEAAAGVLHGLEDDHADVLGALGEDRLLDRVGGGAAGRRRGSARGSVLRTWRVSGDSGSNGAFAAGMPVIESAPSEQPW